MSVTPADSRSVPHFRLTPQRIETFLTRLAETGNVGLAASRTDGNVNTRRSYLRLAANDPAFKAQLDDALEAYASKVAQVLNEEVIEGNLAPAISAGSIVKDKNGKEIWLRRRDPKLVAMLARAHNAKLRDSKTIVNVDGSPVCDPNDLKVVLSLSDLDRLDISERQSLLALCRKVYANRLEEFAAPEMKTIGADYEDVTPINPDDCGPDPWENEKEAADVL